VRKQWTVGVSTQAGSFHPQQIDSIRLLPALGARDFLADPFLVPGSGGRVLLCEWLQARRAKGVIARIELDARGSIADLTVVIDSDRCHLSYPYTLRHEGKLYCCPEAARSRQVVLYGLSDDARRVADSTVLLDGFPGLDPSLFEHEGRWWLLCTSADNGHALSHLYAFHAPRLHGPWTAHTGNPIVNDAARARPAGNVFQHDGELFRPGQDCSQSYGAAIRISRIVKLTPESYVEAPVWTISPPVSPLGRDGVHTLSLDAGHFAVDAYTNVYDPLAWLQRARHRLYR